jgi:hypothetical protein
MGLISWLASVMVLAALTVHAEEGPHRFSVDLPTGWQQASHLRLVLEGMTVAGGQPFKLRAAAILEGAEPVMLGSAGIVGDRSVGSAPRRLPTLLIDVTRPLGKLADRLVRNRPSRSASKLSMVAMCRWEGSTGRCNQSGWKRAGATSRTAATTGSG